MDFEMHAKKDRVENEFALTSATAIKILRSRSGMLALVRCRLVLSRQTVRRRQHKPPSF